MWLAEKGSILGSMLERIKIKYHQWLENRQKAQREHIENIEALQLMHKQCIQYILEHGTSQENSYVIGVNKGALCLSMQPMDGEGLLEYEQPDAELWYEHLGIDYEELVEGDEGRKYSSLVDPYNNKIHYFHVLKGTTQLDYVREDGTSDNPQILSQYRQFLSEKVLPIISS